MSASADLAGLETRVDPAEAEYRRAKRREAIRRKVLPCLGILIGIAVWAALVDLLKVPPFIAPAPLVVLETLVAKSDVLLSNLWPTMVEAVGGFIIGNVFAIALATLFVHRKALSETFFPLVVLINSIPVVAKAPILVLLLGNGMEPKIAIAAIICFFPTLVNMTRGLRDVRAEQLELMRILSATPREVFFRIRVPNALPYLFSALKIAASTAVIGAIVGEWIGSTKGIGALIIQSTYNFDSPLLYATIVVGSTFSALFFGVVSFAEGRMLRWNVAHRN
jgi:NitT/TauT family transport system permease protein